MTIEALRPFPAPTPFPLGLHSPFTPVGYTPGGTPVYPAQGGRSGGGVEFSVRDDDGSPDFDDDDDDEDGRDEDDDEDEQDDEPPRKRTRRGQQPADGDGDTDWTPPDREAWERVQDALRRANGEAGRRRRVGKVMSRLGIEDLERWMTERGIDPETGIPYGSDVVDPDDEGDGYGPDGDFEREDDSRQRRREESHDTRRSDRDLVRQIRTAEQRGRDREREVLMPALAEVTARLALRDAGFTGNAKQLDRMLRSIDPADLDLDSDGDGFELVGMDEAIAQLRDDFPQFFGDEEEERPRRRAARSSGGTGTGTRSRGARDVDGGNRGRQPAAPKGWKEIIAQQMIDGRRG